MKILVVFGTRPEAIKLGPLIMALKAHPNAEVKICVTAQHRQMLDQVLDVFRIVPDVDLNIMQANQTLAQVTSQAVKGLDDVMVALQPDIIIVHGDTTTTFTTALTAFYHKIPVGHVEAGLRSYQRYSPWPEEMNRVLTADLANLHFAPTPLAAENLLKQGIKQDTIFVTGNTVVDACLQMQSVLKTDQALIKKLATRFDFLDANKKLILVTSHRRENFGRGFEQICDALLELANRSDVQIVYPVHLNPNIKDIAYKMLGKHKNIFLIEPQDYIYFSYLMFKSYLILTDSGGVQEEAPSYAKPVLVLRDVTERPEIVSAGLAKLVGTNHSLIVNETIKLLDDQHYYEQIRCIANPFGDGHAAERIAKIILDI